MNVDIGLSKVNSSIAERDDSGGRIRIKSVQEWELWISNDAGSLLRAVLETHEADQEIRDLSDFEPWDT